MGDEGEVDLDALADALVFEPFGNTWAIDLVVDAAAEVGEVALAVGVLDVGEKRPAVPHEVEAAPEKISGRAHEGRVDVVLGESAASKEHGDRKSLRPRRGRPSSTT